MKNTKILAAKYFKYSTYLEIILVDGVVLAVFELFGGNDAEDKRETIEEADEAGDGGN